MVPSANRSRRSGLNCTPQFWRQTTGSEYLAPGCRTPGGVASPYLFVGLRRFRRAGRVLMRSMTSSVHAMPTSS
jgi:hypothetical protein